MSNQPVEGDFRMKGRVAEVFYQGEWKSCDLRTPYERGRADMLEQVIEWIRENLPYGYKGCTIDLDCVLPDLKEAMRPQEDN